MINYNSFSFITSGGEGNDHNKGMPGKKKKTPKDPKTKQNQGDARQLQRHAFSFYLDFDPFLVCARI